MQAASSLNLQGSQAKMATFRGPWDPSSGSLIPRRQLHRSPPIPRRFNPMFGHGSIASTAPVDIVARGLPFHGTDVARPVIKPFSSAAMDHKFAPLFERK